MTDPKHLGNPTRISPLVAAFLLVVSGSNAEPVETVVLATSGEVQSNAGPVQKGQSLTFGQQVQSADKSGAMLSPVPGQLVFLDSGTTIKPLATEIRTDNGPVRSSSLFLGSGHVHSTVEKAKQGSNTQEVRTPCGRLTSSDGSWSTWSTEGKEGVTQHAAVYHGTVTLNRSSQVVALSEAVGGTPANGQSLQVTEGQVVSWKCDDPDGAVTLVDLRTGRLITYINGVEISNIQATPQQLMEARALFEQGMGPFLGMASDSSRIAFGQLLSDINKVLAANMLPQLPLTAEWQLFPDWFKQGLRAPADLASPEQPNP